VTVSLPRPLLHRLCPLLGERLVAIDPGSRSYKMLVVESTLGGLRVLQRQTIDLQEEPRLGAEPVQGLAREVLPGLGPHRLALVLPQHRTIAQTLELPGTRRADLAKTVSSEATKLSGFNEETLRYDFAPLRPFARYQRPVAVTLCRAEEISELLERHTPAPAEDARAEDPATVCELTTTAQALFVAAQLIRPRIEQGVLAELGANHTVVAIVVRRQLVFATSFEVGGEQFTAALAKLKGCLLPVAEAHKRAHNLLAGPDTLPGFEAVVGRWAAEVKRCVAEWLEDHGDAELTFAGLPVYLTGGGAGQPGLIEHLNRLGPLRFESWPALPADDADWPMDPYWVAYGAACQALRRVPRALSLLPPELRAARRRHRVWAWTQAASVVLMVLVALLLGRGTAQHRDVLERKQGLLSQIRTARDTATQIAALAQQLDSDYERLYPVLQSQLATADALDALTAFMGARTNDDFWFVSFGDALSYATATAPGATNLVNGALVLAVTNLPLARQELIVELCIPQEGDAMRRILSQVVTNLKAHALFRRVDALPPERKRQVVDAGVILSNRVHALFMELAPQPLPAPVGPTSRLPLADPSREPRRVFPTPWPRTDSGAPATSPTNR